METEVKPSDVYNILTHDKTKEQGFDFRKSYRMRKSNNDHSRSLDFSDAEEYVKVSRLRLTIIPEQLIKNLKVGFLDFPEQSTGKILIENCWIGELNFRKGANIDIEIIDAWIGKIKLEPNLFTRIFMSGGGLLCFDCPTPQESNPFAGNVLIHSNFFLPKKDGYFKNESHGTQPWANVRSHLLRLGNLTAASRILSCELSIERRQTKGLHAEKAVSWLYDKLCDYGNSIGRPVAWLLAMWLVVSVVYFWGDGTALTEQQQEYVNWRRVFICGDFGKAVQAIWLSSQWFLNPLGFLKVSSPVEPSSAFFAFIHAFHRLFSTVLVFLMFLAIRRKFRMSGA